MKVVCLLGKVFLCVLAVGFLVFLAAIAYVPGIFDLDEEFPTPEDVEEFLRRQRSVV